jgi:hypothetical protein
MFVKLQDKEYKVKFDFNSIADLEERMDKGIGEILKEKNVGFHVVRMLYWAGLRQNFELRNMSCESVGVWLQQRIESGEKFADLMQDVTKELIASGVLGKAEGET